MSKTTTAAEIIAAAHETADEITRVIGHDAEVMRDAAAIVTNILQNATSTKNVDRLFEFAATATAAANAAIDANWTAANHASYAVAQVHKARRTAAAYKAAATRAGLSAESIERRAAAEQAAQIVEDAYHAAEEERHAGNRAMNAAIDDAREVIKTAKLAAAAEVIRSNQYATEADARETIRRNLDTRAKDIDAATRDWRRAMPTNEWTAVKVAAYVFATEAEQAKEDERAERSAKLATTRTRHMSIGEKKQQAHTIDGANGWSARIEYAKQAGNRISCDWRVEVYRNDIYVCHDLFHTIEEAEAYAESMTREPEPEPAAKPYTIICTTKANRTEYLHAVTVEAENAAEAKKAAAEQVEQATGRHAFTPATITTAAASKRIVWCADRWGVTASDVIEAAQAPQGIDIYGTAPKAEPDPAQVATEAMQEAEKAAQEAAEAERKTTDAATIYDTEAAGKHAAEAEQAAQRAEILAGIEDPKTRKYFTAHAIAHQWSPEETAQNLAHMQEISAANAAALALLDAYADVTGEYPHEDNPETVAAYRVARDEITGTSARATEYDRETVNLMTDIIARDSRRPDLDKYAGMAFLELDDAPGTIYQRHELEAFLGEPDDYDVDAIEAEATETDPKTGAQLWTPEAVRDLMSICERHELKD